MPRKCSAHLSLCLHVETRQTISQHFVSIHASLTASFETSSLRSEAESSGLRSPSKTGEKGVSPVHGVGVMQFKRAEWVSREDGVSEISAPCGPMTTVYVAASVCETLHQAQGPQGEGKGSPSSAGLSQDRAHQVSGNPLCRPLQNGTRILQAHPHLPWRVRWGTSQSP